MDEREWLAEKFEERRPRLRAVAYRMLGSLSYAEDAVQEAWLRLSGTAYGEVDDLGAWLTTVVVRVSLNMLRSRRTRSGTNMPEPIIDRAAGMSPEHAALLANTVGLALQVVLETLVQPERVAFALHDIFGTVVLSALFSPFVFLGGFWVALAGLILLGHRVRDARHVTESSHHKCSPGMPAQLLLRRLLSGIRRRLVGCKLTTGLLYDYSRTALIAFSILVQVTAIPFFIAAAR